MALELRLRINANAKRPRNWSRKLVNAQMRIDGRGMSRHNHWQYLATRRFQDDMNKSILRREFWPDRW